MLSLAFGLGMLHALDADHIAAVTGLSGRKATLADSVRFCTRWAMGHGASLLVIGGAVLLLGMGIPERLSAFAESLVGVVLISIGLWIGWDLWRNRAHLHFHRHDDMPEHAHWHKHSKQSPQAHVGDPHRHSHSAVMVGMLHGTAGSAPLLALLPLAGKTSPWLGMSYLLLFGIGVLLAMLAFGGLLGGVFRLLSRLGNRLIIGLRALVGAGSIAFGGYLLHGLG